MLLDDSQDADRLFLAYAIVLRMYLSKECSSVSKRKQKSILNDTAN